MWPFRRRRRGLGAAVTAIPSLVAPANQQLRVTPSTVERGTLVELGFGDGSRAALAPDSPQARALADLAAVLVARD